MSLAQITLTTNKTVSNVGDYIRKIGQGERGQVLTVLVTDQNGAPYNLTGKSLVFSETKNSGQYVVDDGKGTQSGKFALIDAAHGKFSYTLQDQVYTESGTVWFNIVNPDGTVVDTTISFKFKVIQNLNIYVSNSSYSSTLEAFQVHYQSVIQKAESNTQSLINSLTEKINQAISNGQKDVANSLADTKAKLQAVLNQENSLIQNWTADFNQRKADWQAQYKRISDDYTSKVNQINTEAQSQRNQIQAKADQQFKSNQSTYTAAIAKIDSDRDVALRRANTDFANQKNALQADYDKWKTDQIAKLSSLNQEIDADKKDLAGIHSQIAQAQKDLADLEYMVKHIDLANELLAKKASGIKVRGLRGDYVMAVDPTTSLINATPGGSGTGLVDSTVLGGIIQTFADAILDKNHYTKSEVEQMVNNAKNQLQNAKADKSQIVSLNNMITELERKIKDSEIPTFNTLSEYQLWAKDHPNRLAYVLDDTK